jgi:superfamily I DNA and/or RNA helicase
MQHRMHPEISILIRELMYPDLLDGPRTTDKKRPRGVNGRVVFVNHTHPEVESSDIVDRRDSEPTNSRQNEFEVKMVLKLVKYLTQCNHSHLVISLLSGYLFYVVNGCFVSHSPLCLNKYVLTLSRGLWK